jgi:general secretion pathway protein A
LVVEEAHNLSFDLWEEVRVLANRLGRPGGFTSMILVGQTTLAQRIATRPFAAIEARLSARVHLGPIGVDEAGQLLGQTRAGHVWTVEELESLHRDASGNPGRLLRLAGAGIESADRLLDPTPKPPAIDRHHVGIATGAELAPSPPSPSPHSTSQTAQVSPSTRPAPLTGPAKPPILVEENVIEVGWAAEETTEPDARVGSNARIDGPKDAIGGNEEAVQDHYAALQAWREWAENQARQVASSAETDSDELDEELEDDTTDPVSTSPPRSDRPTVRAEGEQKFAPFGHLFTRMAQAREPE